VMEYLIQVLYKRVRAYWKERMSFLEVNALKMR